jgi:hypothetical protein
MRNSKSSVLSLSPWLRRLALLMSLLTLAALGQQASIVPTLVNFKGIITDVNGKPMAGTVGVTFYLYQDSEGGTPLWMETQNVQPDKSGRYAVSLGATKSVGLPTDVFVSGEARWLGVQPEGQAEQPRVLLLSVPYALKAGDAETIGGFPASAFLRAAPPAVGSLASSNPAATVPPPAATDVTTTGGTLNYLPIFSGAATIIDSAVFQTGSGTTAKVGINTTTPVTQLDVNGAGNIRGTLSLPATGVATATGGKNSQGLNMVASSFSSMTSTALNQVFRWQAEPAANNTATPSGTLNLQYGLGATTPTETGLKISSKGLFTFATGQTFPGTGDGSVTSVATGLGLKGGTITKTGTLTIDATVVPQLAVANTFKANQTINGNLTATGTITANALSAPDGAILGSIGITSSSPAPTYFYSSATDADTLQGIAGSSTGNAVGVYGETDSSAGNAYGVYGNAVASSGNPIGVYGGASSSSFGVGVFGQYGTESTTATNLISGNFTGGVWGDGSNISGYGVIGTVDDGFAGLFENNSPDGYETLFVEALDGASLPFYAAGPNDKYCEIDSVGDLGCTGTKNALVPIDGGKRTVAMSAIESPQNWFEDFGSALLAGGVAIVRLDPDFIQTIDTEMDYKVFPVPNGDCKGLFVTHKTPTSFEVRELGGGTSSVSFDYRITAVRKNYENVRFADHTHDLDGHKRMLARAHAAGATKQQSHIPTKKLVPPRPPIQTTAVK